MKGIIPLQSEALKAFESLMEPVFEEDDRSGPFTAEKALIANLKKAFLVIAGSAVQKFMDRIKDEQEILLASPTSPLTSLPWRARYCAPKRTCRR